jgi:hypothetical protein
MKTVIENQIKQVIRQNIVGKSVIYRGQNRTIRRFANWGPFGFEFRPDFDLAAIPISGPMQTYYKSALWVFIDIDGNQGKQVYLEPHWGPLEISFNGTEYNVNDSGASFSEMWIH